MALSETERFPGKAAIALRRARNVTAIASSAGNLLSLPAGAMRKCAALARAGRRSDDDGLGADASAIDAEAIHRLGFRRRRMAVRDPGDEQMHKPTPLPLFKTNEADSHVGRL